MIRYVIPTMNTMNYIGYCLRGSFKVINACGGGWVITVTSLCFPIVKNNTQAIQKVIESTKYTLRVTYPLNDP